VNLVAFIVRRDEQVAFVFGIRGRRQPDPLILVLCTSARRACHELRSCYPSPAKSNCLH
jgi:hypothetical protein